MCGIVGAIDFAAELPAARLSDAVVSMRDTLVARGPDDAGLWVDAAAGIGLGHRRLAIVDLSPGGHQPMTSASGRYVVVFNGEIYNFDSLRKELGQRGHNFRTKSDTEVLLAACEEWGVEHALTKFNGMFAIAIWDAQQRALCLARDRFGEKPLYYAMYGSLVIFGSELKALRAWPHFQPPVDRQGLASLLQFLYVPAPRTIYLGVRKLPPATWVRLRRPADVSVAPTPYWSALVEAASARADIDLSSRGDAVDQLDALLRESIRLRVVADVPVGAFLSGGVDSSTVVALMQAQSTQRVRTFTIGFSESGYDEAPAARAVAEHLGTDHTEVYVSADEALAIVPRLARVYDEPFADSSQIPTILISEIARKQVTVALSGDGGDELFGGYRRYFWAQAIWAARSAQAKVPFAHELVSWGSDRASRSPRFARFTGERSQRMTQMLSRATIDGLYLDIMSSGAKPEELVLSSEDLSPHIVEAFRQTPAKDSYLDRMSMTDVLTYLPGDILTKVDRAAMSVSLETRIPILDPAILHFAWRLPQSYRLSWRGRGKTILRDVLGQYVPRRLFERPKKGFGVPLHAWLGGPLKTWASDLLNEDTIKRDGYLDSRNVSRLWRAHLSGERRAQNQLWPILIFQQWLHATRG